ncbi:MAG: SUMF1/EgtB/PvdO family nonheme iron enzyme [Chloroflexi bacterium]|nr:SUMF1/EgtB/PvdO family nonheme iron enzyme [Chloroflexota bacterium]
MPRIFISYRRADSAMAAGRIHDRLVAVFGPENIFKDVDDIPPGEDFRIFIAKEIARTDIMLVLIGAQWLNVRDNLGSRRLTNPADYVRIEIETGLKNEHCRVVPVLLGGTSMPPAPDLPDSMQDMVFLNAPSVRDDPDFNRDVDRLIRWLRGENVEFDIQAAIDEFYPLYRARRWGSALELLNKIRQSGRAPNVFNVEVYEQTIRQEMAREEAERQQQEKQDKARIEYRAIRIMAQHEEIEQVWECWQIYCKTYDYDPDGFGKKLAQKLEEKRIAERRDREYNALLEQVTQNADPETLQRVLSQFRQQFGDYDPEQLAAVIAEQIAVRQSTERQRQEQEREQEYGFLFVRLAQRDDLAKLQILWKAFQERYGVEYDPDGFANRLAEAERIRAQQLFLDQRQTAYDRVWQAVKSDPRNARQLMADFAQTYADFDPDRLSEIITAKILELQEAEHQREQEAFERFRADEYVKVRALAERDQRKKADKALLSFQKKYPDYDPDGIGEWLAQPPPQEPESATPDQVIPRERKAPLRRGGLVISAVVVVFGVVALGLVFALDLLGGNQDGSKSPPRVSPTRLAATPTNDIIIIPTSTLTATEFIVVIPPTLESDVSPMPTLTWTPTMSAADIENLEADVSPMPTLTWTPTMSAADIENTVQALVATRNAIETSTAVRGLTLTAAAELAQLTGTLAPARNTDWTPIIQTMDGLPYVYVPAGCFMMGSENGDDERPVHEVCLDAFWIGQTEITNVQYGSEGNFSGANRPRENVTWFEARDFCESQGARLPTEAEWEYAARGPESWMYPWRSEFVADNVVYSGNSGGQTAEVGSKPGGTSWVGALDMSGNVWEWLSSIYRWYPYSLTDGREGIEDIDSGRALRGGSFVNSATDDFRSANRNAILPTDGGNGIGFRCAHDAEG